MPITTSEKIKIILRRQGLSVSQLAQKTNQSRQNLSQKLSRDNFGEKELHEIAEAMGVEYASYFILPDGEKF